METKRQNSNSGIILAFILIGLGMIWLLKTIGLHFDIFSVIWNSIWAPFRFLFNSFGSVFFSWQLLMVLVGLILLIGRRTTAGIILVVVGGFFLLPEIFSFHVFSASFLIPVVLIGAGVAIVVRKY